MKRLVLAALFTLALAIIASPTLALNHQSGSRDEATTSKLNQRFRKEHQETLDKLNQRFRKAYEETLNR